MALLACVKWAVIGFYNHWSPTHALRSHRALNMNGPRNLTQYNRLVPGHSSLRTYFAFDRPTELEEWHPHHRLRLKRGAVTRRPNARTPNTMIQRRDLIIPNPCKIPSSARGTCSVGPTMQNTTQPQPLQTRSTRTPHVPIPYPAEIPLSQNKVMEANRNVKYAHWSRGRGSVTSPGSMTSESDGFVHLHLPVSTPQS